jgi:hypothetical protein
MGGSLGSKINQVLKTWPHGTVALSSWLESQGVYQQLAHKYEQTGWFERVGHGAFVRSGEKVSWQGALYAIQTQAGLPIHAAAKTALEIQGITHFVAAGRKRLFLFGPAGTALPSWFKKKDWGVIIRYATPELFLGALDQGLTEKSYGDFSIRTSSLERAILELLYFVPAQQQYEESKQLFEGLRALRPNLVQSLLETCNSIKVKRLFLHLAEETNQPWFEDLKLAKIDLGKGKRVIAGGGRFDSKYSISVPIIREGETLDAEEEA